MKVEEFIVRKGSEISLKCTYYKNKIILNKSCDLKVSSDWFLLGDYIEEFVYIY